MKRGRILIIDDSPTARASLRAALASDRELTIVGEAADGVQARKLLASTPPDLITMDVFLRAESGLDLTAAIMQEVPTPIVVVTAADPRDASLLFRAMQAGALEVCAKLPGPTHPEYAARCARLIRTIKSLQSVPVVHRRRTAVTRAAPRDPAPQPAPRRAAAPAMLLLGASTGGPPVVARVLRELPRPLPISVALVQHMVLGFVPGFAKWLADETGHEVRLVTEPCPTEPGVIYLPAGDRHLVLAAADEVATIDAPPQSYHRPSIDVLFESGAAAASATRLIAVLLTGMGADGARGLLALRRAGAYTLVQDPKSCAVASMPNRAIELDAADRVAPPELLPEAIRDALTGSRA